MNRILNRASTLGLLLLYTLPISYLIAGCFHLTLDSYTPLWLIGICLSVWIAADFKHGVFLGLPLSAVILFAAYRTYDGELAVQLSDLFDRMTGAYYERFYAPGSSFGYAYFSESHTLVVLFIVFLLASYLSTGLTSRSGRVFFSMMGTLPPFIFSIIITGTPSTPATVCLVFFWILLMVGGSRYNVDSHQGRAVFAAALPAALVLGLILLAQPPSEYTYSEEDVSISQRFEGVGQAIRQWMSRQPGTVLTVPEGEREPGTLASPSPTSMAGFGSEETGEMELSGGYDFTGIGETAMRARTDAGGYIYLRGRSYGDYAGDAWLEADEPDNISSLPFAAYGARLFGAAEHEMELRLEMPSTLRYLPYYSSLSQSSDVYVPLNGQRNYTVSYYDQGSGFLSLPPEYIQPELEYRAYAHDYYTRLPDRTKSDLLALAGQAGIRADSVNVIQEVAEYVRDAGVYDLSTDTYPSDDYAVYFLTEAHQGYCIHFATAAAALYRALGIPARVTEGFLYISRPGEWTDVLRSDAHAWVEVYEDGIGWLPVEVTGSSGLAPSDEGLTDPVESTAPTPEESPASEPAEEDEGEASAATPVPSPESTPAGPSVGIISPETGLEPETEPEEPQNPFPWKLLLYPVLVLLLAALIPLRRRILLELVRKKISQRDGRKAAVAIWRQAVRVAAYGTPVPEDITKCAEKATFSLHDISREELTACRALLDGMTQETYSRLNGFKRFSFKHLKCIM